MGAGGSGVAAKNTNRQFIGIELNENYYKIARNRIFNEDNEIEQKVNETFKCDKEKNIWLLCKEGWEKLRKLQDIELNDYREIAQMTNFFSQQLYPRPWMVDKIDFFLNKYQEKIKAIESDDRPTIQLKLW